MHFFYFSLIFLVSCFTVTVYQAGIVIKFVLDLGIRPTH